MGEVFLIEEIETKKIKALKKIYSTSCQKYICKRNPTTRLSVQFIAKKSRRCDFIVAKKIPGQ